MSSDADILIRTGAGGDPDGVVELYRAVGWTRYADDPAVLSAALSGSSREVTAYRSGRLVGLARVISDGATICFSQDILVRPDAQRSGVGRRLWDAVMEPYRVLRQTVLLTDDEPGQRAFYRSLGLAETGDHGDGTLRAFVRFVRSAGPSRCLILSL